MQEALTWQDRLLDFLEYLWLYVTSIFQSLYRFRLFIIEPSEGSEYGTNPPLQRKKNLSEASMYPSRIRDSRFPNLSSKIPPLEAIPDTSNISHAESCTSSNNNDYDHDEIPPAFLTEEEYPEGWLVFDLKQGKVVLKKKKTEGSDEDQCGSESPQNEIPSDEQSVQNEEQEKMTIPKS